MSGKVLAVASGGGHWVQLTRLAPALSDCDVTFMTTLEGVASPVAGARVIQVSDASRSNKIGLVRMAAEITWQLLKLRPNVVITTGAAPGLVALTIGKWMGARTVWIDSIANVDEISMSGKLARVNADLWLTQWPHLESTHPGLSYCGSVI